MTAHKINKHLKELQNYKNLYKKYKTKYIHKKYNSKQQGGILTNEDNKSYSNKLNQFKDRIVDILDRKHNIYFIEYSISELQKQNDLVFGGLATPELSHDEQTDFKELTNKISKLDNKDIIQVNKIYNELLLFLKKYNYTNLIHYAEEDIKQKKINRYGELIIEFDKNNYNRDGFRKYHKLQQLPKDINSFKSTIQNHYKEPKYFKYIIENKLKNFFSNFNN